MTAVSPEVDVTSREALLREIDELSAPLGYGSGEFLGAWAEGAIPDTPEVSSILVLVPLLR